MKLITIFIIKGVLLQECRHFFFIFSLLFLLFFISFFSYFIFIRLKFTLVAKIGYILYFTVKLYVVE